MGKLVPISGVSVALADPGLPNDMCVVLPDHLEEIVTGSHPSLGEVGRQLLRELLHRYRPGLSNNREIRVLPGTVGNTGKYREIVIYDIVISYGASHLLFCLHLSLCHMYASYKANIIYKFQICI